MATIQYPDLSLSADAIVALLNGIPRRTMSETALRTHQNQQGTGISPRDAWNWIVLARQHYNLTFPVATTGNLPDRLNARVAMFYSVFTNGMNHLRGLEVLAGEAEEGIGEENMDEDLANFANIGRRQAVFKAPNSDIKSMAEWIEKPATAVRSWNAIEKLPASKKFVMDLVNSAFDKFFANSPISAMKPSDFIQMAWWSKEKRHLDSITQDDVDSWRELAKKQQSVLDDMQSQFAALTASIQTYSDELAAKKDKVAELTQSLDSLTADIQAQSDDMVEIKALAAAAKADATQMSALVARVDALETRAPAVATGTRPPGTIVQAQPFGNYGMFDVADD